MSTALKQAFVLIGTQGSGKSATGNSIIGATRFKSMTGTEPLTKEIKEEGWHWQNRDITIIDTPPLNGQYEITKITNHARKKCINIKYLFILSIGRPLPSETSLLELVYEQLDRTKEDLVLIFVRYDDLEQENSFECWLSDCPALKAFIQKTNVKYFPFANKNGNKPVKDQVNDLMSIIMGNTKEIKPGRSQAHGNATTKIKQAEIQGGLKLQPEINDELPVSCELLEEHFGKSGVTFYNEVLKKNKR